MLKHDSIKILKNIYFKILKTKSFYFMLLF